MINNKNLVVTLPAYVINTCVEFYYCYYFFALDLKGLPPEIDLVFDDVWLVLGLNRGRDFFTFFWCYNDYTAQKLYFSPVMRFYDVGLLMY